MKLIELQEPQLEFGGGYTHICPRHGIGEFSVYDASGPIRSDRIVCGIVGTDDGIRVFERFIGWSRKAVETDATNNRQYPSFCGFDRGFGFNARLETGAEVQQIVPGSEIRTVKAIGKFQERVSSAVALYLDRIEYICSFKKPDVVVCVLPEDLYERVRHFNEDNVSDDTLEAEYETSSLEVNFRSMLKAKALRHGVPLQIVRVDSLLEEAKDASHNAATRAWNLCTALYFKSSIAAPWKLHSSSPSYPTCFVGVSFFKSVDAATVDASTAQIFDELGKSVILRGRPASVASEDRAPYLKSEDAYQLLKDALKTYRTAVRTAPARLVIHKTSRFIEEEIKGFERAADDDQIEMLDLVSIAGSSIRLYREHLYPPIRGSMLDMGRGSAILYTRGSVPFFRTYPGPFIPQPLEVRVFRSDRGIETICSEILGLTKMNWNNTQFDNKNPITLGCSRRVGEVIKYLGEQDLPQPSYAYYM